MRDIIKTKCRILSWSVPNQVLKIKISAVPNRIRVYCSRVSCSRTRPMATSRLAATTAGAAAALSATSTSSRPLLSPSPSHLPLRRQLLPSCRLRVTFSTIITTRRSRRLLAALDDFEVEDVVDYEIDAPVDDEDEDDMRDYDLELEPAGAGSAFVPVPLHSSSIGSKAAVDAADSGGEVETVVDYKINEDEFHKLRLHTCDFFIRKAPDPDNDVFDFSEMYVTAPDTDVYAVPKRRGQMPTKPVRLMKSNYEYICVTEPPVDRPRSPLYKSDKHVMKVFLIKHYKNRRTDDWDFVLDFEEVYVIDTKTKTISRAPVEVHVPGGKKRDRSTDLLTVRDDGNSFRIIHQDERNTPCEIVEAMHWEKSREKMETYLKGFRDYEVSNWF